ncbi:MAG: EamA family transporter [Isosphaeraceae bacterium]
MNWVLYAAFSAVFAGLTAVLAKIGVSDIPSNVATLVRTIVVVVFAAGIVAASGQLHHLRSIPGRSWLALVFSGVATGLSWLFYFAALKQGPVSGVAPIDKLSFVIAMTLGFLVLGETARPLTLVGAALILAGVLLTLPSVQDFLGGRQASTPSASTSPEVNHRPPPREPPPQSSARPG